MSDQCEPFSWTSHVARFSTLLHIKSGAGAVRNLFSVGCLQLARGSACPWVTAKFKCPEIDTLPINMPRPRGRPRNQALDRLEHELSVSRRHARRLLREAGHVGAPAAPDKSPLAHARLDKLLKECSLLEIKIASARLEERRLAGELLFFDEARELVAAPLQAIKNMLVTMPKSLAPRLYGQPQKAIEQVLADFVDGICREAARAIEKVKGRKAL